MSQIEADVPLYESLSTFLGVPSVSDVTTTDADVLIQGIPFDLGTAGRPGTRYGPKSIRSVSSNLKWDSPRWPWRFVLTNNLSIADTGDLYCQTGVPQTMVDQIEAKTDAMLAAGKKVLSFGGDHYISWPLVKSHARHHGKLSLLHFDAHTDDYNGPDYDHGTMFYHAVQQDMIDPSHSVQIGIRTAHDVTEDGFNILDADWVNNNGPAATLEKIRNIVGNNAVYLTFDIDGLDPAFAPGTGTPVVGGFSTNFALQVIRGLTDVNVIGMDVVEVSPPYDHSEITALAGATIAMEMLHVWAEQKRSNRFQGRT